MIFEELKVRGLAKDSEDSVSIPMHPQVRNLVLVLLAEYFSLTAKTWDLSCIRLRTVLKS